MQQYPYRRIQSLNTAFSGRWTAWYALGLYAFFLLLGVIEVSTGTRHGFLFVAVGVFGFVMLAIGRLRMRAVAALPSVSFDPYAPSWVREAPITPAIAVFAKRLRARMLALTGVTAIIAGVGLILIGNWPHNRSGLIAPIAVTLLSVVLALALMPLYSDTRCATYWEAAGPLRAEPVWQMTQPMIALHIGNERLLLPPKAAKRIAGLPWAWVAATCRTAQVMEVRDWHGNVVYRAPGYRPIDNADADNPL